MLTSKQLLRRQKQKNSDLRNFFAAFAPPSESSEVSADSLEMSVSSSDSLSISEGSESISASMEDAPVSISTDQCWASADQIYVPPNTLNKIRKRLRFHNFDEVVLIPCVNEYRTAGLHSSVWCSQAELQGFKLAAHEEIRKYMRANNCKSVAEAVTALFQVEAQDSI